MNTASVAPSGILIQAEHVTKTYRTGSTDATVLSDASLTVGEGEMCAIMGPSGCGKSTLLYCLAGLEPVTTGSVRLLGNDVVSMNRTQLAKLRRSDIGFVFQSYNLVPTLSAVENVLLPFRLRGERTPRVRAIDALRAVGIERLADARPTSMSGGEQQRVALARVIAQEPRVVFADEPTGALDSASGRLVLDELTAIGHALGRCVVMVTHDPSVAAACDRVVFMIDGRFAGQMRGGSAEEIAAHLASLSAPAAGRAA